MLQHILARHAEDPGEEATVPLNPEDYETFKTGGGRTRLPGGEDELHIVNFMRRHGPGDALRIASSVLFATVGVIEIQHHRANETALVRTIAREIQSVARGILTQDASVEDEGEKLRRGIKRLNAGEVVRERKKSRKRTKSWKQRRKHSRRRGTGTFLKKATTRRVV